MENIKIFEEPAPVLLQMRHCNDSLLPSSSSCCSTICDLFDSQPQTIKQSVTCHSAMWLLTVSFSFNVLTARCQLATDRLGVSPISEDHRRCEERGACLQAGLTRYNNLRKPNAHQGLSSMFARSFTACLPKPSEIVQCFFETCLKLLA